MPRQKPSANKRRYQIGLDKQWTMYGRAIGVVPHTDKVKRKQTLAEFIETFNSVLDAAGKVRGEEPRTWVLENETPEGKAELASVYNTIAGYFRRHYRLIDGKLTKILIQKGKLSNPLKYPNGDKVPAELLEKVKPVTLLPVLDGIELSTESTGTNESYDVDDDMLSQLTGDDESDSGTLEDLLA